MSDARTPPTAPQPAPEPAPPPPPIDAEVEGALDRVAQPKARPDFRDSLRQRFLAVAPAAPEAKSFRARFGGPRISRRALGYLAAAAVLLALGYFLVTRETAPTWKVLEVAPGSVVIADGARMPIDDADALARALAGANEITVEQGEVVVRVGDLALFGVGAGTRVAFGGFEAAGDLGSLSIRARSGRLRARTGPAFQGRRLDVQAESMTLAVTGTTFAVDYEDAGTCVCCLQGSVEITSASVGPGRTPIPAGRMCLVPKSGRPPEWGDSPAEHAQPLRALEERARAIWP